MNLRVARTSLFAPALILVGGSVVVPFVMAAIESLRGDDHWTLANYQTFFGRPPYLQVLGTTLVIALAVTVASVAIAAPACAFFARKSGRVAATFLGVVGASLWISVLVKTYAWQALLAQNGPLNALLVAIGVVSKPQPFLYTRVAVILAMTQAMIPYAALVVFAGMRRVDWELVTAAQTLGANRWQTFWRVYWPQVRTSVVMAAVLVFTIASGFFVTPALVGGPRETMLGMQMHSDLRNRFDSGLASTAGAVLTLVLLVVAGVSLKVTGMPFRRLAEELGRSR